MPDSINKYYKDYVNNIAPLVNNGSGRMTVPSGYKPDKNFEAYENLRYPNSLYLMQIQTHPRGSSPQVAKQLKNLDGSLDEKITKAKDIIMKDMGLPSDLVECEDCDSNKTGYAMYSIPKGIILFDKKFCQKPDAEFSDEAIMCILRHEIDHLEVFTKIYKVLGKEKFAQFLNECGVIKQMHSSDLQNINFDFYEKMSKYVDVQGFDAQPYIDAMNNYYNEPLGESHYKNFNIIIKNFDNELEYSAREKQFELEKLMGVTTLRDFYAMIDATKVLISEIRSNGITEDEKINEKFDLLYEQARNESGLKDKIKNWSKILHKARELNQNG